MKTKHNLYISLFAGLAAIFSGLSFGTGLHAATGGQDAKRAEIVEAFKKSPPDVKRSVLKNYDNTVGKGKTEISNADAPEFAKKVFEQNKVFIEDFLRRKFLGVSPEMDEYKQEERVLVKDMCDNLMASKVRAQAQDFGIKISPEAILSGVESVCNESIEVFQRVKQQIGAEAAAYYIKNYKHTRDGKVSNKEMPEFVHNALKGIVAREMFEYDKRHPNGVVDAPIPSPWRVTMATDKPRPQFEEATRVQVCELSMAKKIINREAEALHASISEQDVDSVLGDFCVTSDIPPRSPRMASPKILRN